MMTPFSNGWRIYCDNAGCNKGIETYITDKRRAKANVHALGWQFNPATNKAECPDCAKKNGVKKMAVKL